VTDGAQDQISGLIKVWLPAIVTASVTIGVMKNDIQYIKKDLAQTNERLKVVDENRTELAVRRMFMLRAERYFKIIDKHIAQHSERDTIGTH